MGAVSLQRARAASALLFLLVPRLAVADRFRHVREMIREEVADGRVPSFAVAVARRGEIQWEEAFGWADRERGIPATTHTMFSLASVSKPMTATGLMVLVRDGRVELDHPINEYLGDAVLTARVGDVGEATVRRVADHTSGLPTYHHFYAGPDLDARPPLADTIRQYGNLVSEPGQRFEYSNLGYGVLGYLIQRVSGVGFARFMREAVFALLGLEHTAVLQAPRATEMLAVRYRHDSTPLPFYGSDHGGGSAVFACVHDLVRFGLFHVGSRGPGQTAILSERAMRAMQRPSSRRPDGASAYGIGWAIQTRRSGGNVVRHDGGMPGVSASLVLIPAAKAVVAALAGSQTDLPQRVVQTVLSAWGQDRTSSQLGLDLRSPDSGRRRRFLPPRRLRGTWRGAVWVGEQRLPLELTVERSADLRASLGHQPERRLRGVAFRDGYLSGWMPGHLGTQGSEAPARSLRLFLKLRGDRLGGSVTIVSSSAEGLPSALSHWAELVRDRSAEPGPRMEAPALTPSGQPGGS